MAPRAHEEHDGTGPENQERADGPATVCRVSCTLPEAARVLEAQKSAAHQAQRWLLRNRAARGAAARPSKTEFLYFVSNGGGGHSFSKTYEGHKKGIEILLTRKKEQSSAEKKGSVTYIRIPIAKPVLLE